MPTSRQSKAFREMLRNQAEEYQQTVGQFDDDDWESFGTLIGAAFALAVRRQFGSEHTPAEVVKLVAELRAQFDPDGDSLDPRVFELMVRSALGEKGLKLASLSDEVVLQIQAVAVGGLAGTGRLGDIDEFAVRAEALSDKWSE